jgi:hypothetical protein
MKAGGKELALKMEVICSSETSVEFQRTTRRYIPEESTRHNHRCENLKSNQKDVDSKHDLLFHLEYGSSTFLRNMGEVQSTLRHIPEESTLRTHRCENHSFNIATLPIAVHFSSSLLTANDGVVPSAFA